MTPITINPFPLTGTKHKEVLDYLILNLPTNPTFEDLNTAIANYVVTPDPNDPNAADLVLLEINAILPFTYNHYVRSGIASAGSGDAPDAGLMLYNEVQKTIIHSMLRDIYAVPMQSIPTFISDIENRIASSRLSNAEQIPLFVATRCGRSNYEYWITQFANLNSQWSPYFNPVEALRYGMVPHWVAAAMQGAIFAYQMTGAANTGAESTFATQAPQVLNIISATIGSTGLVCGKVVMEWGG